MGKAGGDTVMSLPQPSTTSSPRYPCLAAGVREEESNQQWMKIKAGMTWDNSTHTHLWEEDGLEQHIDSPRRNHP